MSDPTPYSDILKTACGDALKNLEIDRGEITIEVDQATIVKTCTTLRDHPQLQHEILIDLCGVDYSGYKAEDMKHTYDGPRFAVVYHLLSLARNRRLRVRTYLDAEFPLIQSVIPVWNSANWFEREAFDMFGFIFEGHPDLRRILSDYGFIGHPFRKDFPLSGHVEMRYDEEKGRVIYQPVTLDPRILVPRVIREEEFGGRNT